MKKHQKENAKQAQLYHTIWLTISHLIHTQRVLLSCSCSWDFADKRDRTFNLKNNINQDRYQTTMAISKTKTMSLFSSINSNSINKSSHKRYQLLLKSYQHGHIHLNPYKCWTPEDNIWLKGWKLTTKYLLHKILEACPILHPPIFFFENK